MHELKRETPDGDDQILIHQSPYCDNIFLRARFSRATPIPNLQVAKELLHFVGIISTMACIIGGGLDLRINERACRINNEQARLRP